MNYPITEKLINVCVELQGLWWRATVVIAMKNRWERR